MSVCLLKNTMIGVRGHVGGWQIQNYITALSVWVGLLQKR